MPHLATQISVGGPIIDVKVGVSRERRLVLEAAKQPVPGPIQIRALVDTGASCTNIDPDVFSQLGLTPTGVATVHTPSTGTAGHVTNQYDVSLVLLHPKLSFTFFAIPVIESQLAIQGIQGLLGRDVLAKCLLVYDGQ